MAIFHCLRFQISQQAATLSSSQPLFYSFSTDEGSRAGNIHASDPYLRASEANRAPRRSHDYDAEDEDDDPYLRLDEEDPGALVTTRNQYP